VPASTTETKTPAPKAPTKLQIADALEKAKNRVTDEFKATSYDAVIELACKLMSKYTKEELKL